MWVQLAFYGLGLLLSTLEAESLPFVKRPSEFNAGTSTISNWRPFSIGSGGGGPRGYDPSPLFSGHESAVVPGVLPILPYVKVHNQYGDRLFPHFNANRFGDSDPLSEQVSKVEVFLMLLFVTSACGG